MTRDLQRQSSEHGSEHDACFGGKGSAMKATEVLDVIDEMIRDTALAANEMALAAPRHFDAIGAGTGVGIRLKALQDVRAAVVDAGLRALESASTVGQRP